MISEIVPDTEDWYGGLSMSVIHRRRMMKETSGRRKYGFWYPKAICLGPCLFEKPREGSLSEYVGITHVVFLNKLYTKSLHGRIQSAW